MSTKKKIKSNLNVNLFSFNAMESRINLLFLFTLIFLIEKSNTQLQTTLSTVKILKAADCTNDQYFDISHLTCVSCPNNTIKQDREFLYMIKVLIS